MNSLPTVMPITFYIETSGFGGTESHLCNVIRLLDRKKYSCSVIVDTLSRMNIGRLLGELQKTQVNKGVEIIVLEGNMFHRLREIPKALQIWSMLKGQSGITHFYKNNSVACFLPMLYAKIQGKRIVQTLQLPTAFGGKHMVSLSRIKERISCLISDKIICVSIDSLKNILKSYHLPTSRVCYIPNGVDPSIAGSFCGKREAKREEIGRHICLDMHDKIVILVPARFVKQKGHDFLIDILTELRINYPNEAGRIVVLLAGDGELEGEIRQRVEQEKLSGTVFFLGGRSDMGELYSAGDAVLLTSLYEGMPLSVLEAMSFGKPVIATSIQGISEIVEHGRNGYLIDYGDSKGGAATIAEFSALSEETRMKMGQASYVLACDKFDLRNHMRTLVGIYEAVWHGKSDSRNQTLRIG